LFEHFKTQSQYNLFLLYCLCPPPLKALYRQNKQAIKGDLRWAEKRDPPSTFTTIKISSFGILFGKWTSDFRSVNVTTQAPIFRSLGPLIMKLNVSRCPVLSNLDLQLAEKEATHNIFCHKNVNF